MVYIDKLHVMDLNENQVLYQKTCFICLCQVYERFLVPPAPLAPGLDELVWSLTRLISKRNLPLTRSPSEYLI